MSRLSGCEIISVDYLRAGVLDIESGGALDCVCAVLCSASVFWGIGGVASGTLSSFVSTFSLEVTSPNIANVISRQPDIAKEINRSNHIFFHHLDRFSRSYGQHPATKIPAMTAYYHGVAKR